MTKVAIITGGTRGIGLGIAKELVHDNWNLVLNGIRHEDVVAETLKQLDKEGNNVVYIRGDISHESGREKILQGALDSFGVINALVNNAGVAPFERSDLLNMTKESYNRVMDINLHGPIFLTQLISRYFVTEKTKTRDFFAAVVNVTSISSAVVSVNRGEYCISKAGLSMASQLFAVRLGEMSIPVYEIRPGIIETDMTAGVKEKYDELFKKGLCIDERWGHPADVGKAVRSLLSGDFPYSSGSVFMIDGGLTVPRL
jgi:3-oxoacyl-[acyl-carrier protein] reductase